MDPREAILRAIHEYVANGGPEGAPWDSTGELRLVAAELSVLPVIADMGGCYCLHASGSVVSFLWDTPRILEGETEDRIVNMVRHRAALSYPGLAELDPPRPAAAVDCPDCGGSGQLAPPLDRVICRCGGLGWLPPGGHGA